MTSATKIHNKPTTTPFLTTNFIPPICLFLPQSPLGMSIIAKDVVKIYGQQKALDTVSFEIPSGGVVGFLGPNGAGKSTMMKIITCFIPPTSGTVSVCGHDVMKDSIAVRRMIGYLP